MGYRSGGRPVGGDACIAAEFERISGKTVSDEKEQARSEPALSWLDEAVADALNVIEQIHTAARAALDAAGTDTPAVAHSAVQSGSFEEATR